MVYLLYRSSIVPQPFSDFRIIDARPEPSRLAQQQSGQTSTSQQPQQVLANDHVGMDVDDEDLKEIAKFLPMLQGTTREQYLHLSVYISALYSSPYYCQPVAAKPKLEPIPLAPPAVYAPTGSITPLQRSLATQASSLASTPSKNSVVTDEDDGDYVYDLYYRDPAVRIADLSGTEPGMGGAAIGAL